MKHILIVRDSGGIKTISPVPSDSIDSYNLPDSAEIFDDKTAFEHRLSDFDGQ